MLNVELVVPGMSGTIRLQHSLNHVRSHALSAPYFGPEQLLSRVVRAGNA
ncbi:hypothetical protein PI124_g22128 [Phytophthora idaei]|nr:hypothetical protein PI125_g22970 [Phytophthora idaei]KAG3129124.1 hypothetical protein PI126_g21104 [Phytophthora idaei]KAG3232792.1 hypothetical protein PI124_g22128 [Phytophthora idaei]